MARDCPKAVFLWEIVLWIFVFWLFLFNVSGSHPDECENLINGAKYLLREQKHPIPDIKGHVSPSQRGLAPLFHISVECRSPRHSGYRRWILILCMYALHGTGLATTVVMLQGLGGGQCSEV